MPREPRISKTVDSNIQDENDDLRSLILSVKQSVESLSSKFDEKIDSLSVSVQKLHMESETSAKSVLSLAKLVNEREQHSRNFSIRISGLKLNADTYKNAISTSKAVYDSILKPILTLAVKDGVLPSVPDVWSLVEYAHMIPSKKQGLDAPVPQLIVRFQARIMRDLIFTYKKNFFSKSETKDVYISEDLTAVNFKKLMEMKKDPKIKAAWSHHGKIFFAETANPEVRKKL